MVRASEITGVAKDIVLEVMSLGKVLACRAYQLRLTQAPR